MCLQLVVHYLQATPLPQQPLQQEVSSVCNAVLGAAAVFESGN